MTLTAIYMIVLYHLLPGTTKTVKAIQAPTLEICQSAALDANKRLEAAGEYALTAGFGYVAACEVSYK